MFDAMTGTTAFDAAEIEKSDKIEMYRKRREDAVALWKTIPDENFYIGFWKDDTKTTSCGITCCAIGWLAEKQHDGWNFSGPNRLTPRRENSGLETSESIHQYFGLSIADSCAIFAILGQSMSLYKHKNLRHITSSDVSAALMAAPYNV